MKTLGRTTQALVQHSQRHRLTRRWNHLNRSTLIISVTIIINSSSSSSSRAVHDTSMTLRTAGSLHTPVNNFVIYCLMFADM